MRAFLIWFACFFLLGSVLLAQEPGNDSSVAIVVDTKGLSTSVYNLKARYEAMGLWAGEKPIKLESSLDILLKIREGHITTEEILEIPFSSIKKISVLRRWNKSMGFYDEVGDIIERTDGSLIKLTRDHIKATKVEELSAAGTSLKTYINVDYFFRIRSGDEWFYLEGYEGQAVTSTGKTGKFHIQYVEVSTIEFK
jgi:hypothetical protein